MRFGKSLILCAMLAVALMASGCGGSGSKRDMCAEPTISECLDSTVTESCRGKGDTFDAICQDILQAENKSPADPSSQLTQALVPELDGAHFRAREIKGVVQNNQPPQYVDDNDTPPTYSFRGARNTLLNINDKLLVKDIYDHSEVFNALDDAFEISPEIGTLMPLKSKAMTVMPVIQATNSNYMFDGLSYSKDNIYHMLDSLYAGEVKEWNDNGLEVDSCEEYVYERYYGFTLFKDFATLHFDDPYRVAEYAFQGAYLDEEGIHFLNFDNIKPGAIGSRNLRYDVDMELDATNIIVKKGTAVHPDPFMVYADPTGKEQYMNSAGYNLDLIYYNYGLSYSTMLPVGDIVDEQVLNSRDHLPKNFFLETLGKINPENTTVANGIILSDPALIAVYDQPDFEDAARAGGVKGYLNNWTYHFVMLQAAQRMVASDTARKKKLLEYKLLRKHLIDLLAERAYWEDKIPTGIIHIRHTYTLLNSSETLSLSEKEYALQKLNEFNSGHLEEADITSTGIYHLPVLTSYTARCSELDAQIEAVLKEAKAKGCLETDTDPSLHNYPTMNNDTIYSSGAPWLSHNNAYDLSYDKVFCDWSPDKLTDAAQFIVPGEILDKAYSQCQRVTGGDFAETAPDNFTFSFPTMCLENNSQFDLWSPNTPVDYTQDTNQFDKFQKLNEIYPKALCDCDSIIEGVVKRELESHGMNYYDPVSGKVMMSKSSSFYNSFGGQYAGLRFGYALGWIYEGYDAIPNIAQNNIANRDFVCSDTHYFSFGNYFVEGSFLTHDFILCSAGSYASNKTTGTSRPQPPTLADDALNNKIIDDMNDVATEENVPLTSFMFIKNEKVSYTYDNTNGMQGDKIDVRHAVTYNNSTHTIDYQNTAVSDTDMLSISMRQTVPVCGIISVTVKGSVTGDIDADTYLTGDNATAFTNGECKSMNFNYTPRIDFDGFASAAVTAGISGVASVSAGIDIGLKFVGLRFPYETDLFISQRPQMAEGNDPDREFNYDIHTNVYSSLDQTVTVLSGYFGAFVEIEYVIDSTTYRQTLFSWDGYNTSGNLDRTGELEDGEKIPVKLPVRALYGLAHKLYQ